MFSPLHKIAVKRNARYKTENCTPVMFHTLIILYATEWKVINNKVYVCLTVLVRLLLTNIDIVRTCGWESSDVAGITVANIAINPWFYDSSSAGSPRART